MIKQLMRHLALLCVLFSISTSGWASTPAKTTVKIKTSLGDIVVALDGEKAPRSVKNFLQYVEEKFYDGTTFHRVIASFMVQGGGYTKIYKRKPTHAQIRNEANNGLKNVRGSIAMARTSDPHSATAQFFFNVVDNPFLDHKEASGNGWGYAVFGHVIEGMDVVDKIRYIDTGAAGPFYSNVPLKTVLINSIRIIPDARFPVSTPSAPLQGE